MFTNITIKYTADNVEETTQTYESISLADLKTAIKTINDANTNINMTLSGVAGTNVASLFYNCKNIISFDFTNFDTSKVTDMSNMFNSCSGITTIPLLDTSNVTIMGGMFRGCSLLESIPLFVTNKVTKMNGMFEWCSKLTSVPKLDTSNVTNMNSMFRGCSSLANVPQLDTSKTTDMDNMFSYCTSLIILNISNFNISKVITMKNMFQYSTNLNTIYVNNLWNTIGKTTTDMFKNCGTDHVTYFYADKRRIMVGDDLKGKTLYMDFPDNYYTYFTENNNRNFITRGNNEYAFNEYISVEYISNPEDRMVTVETAFSSGGASILGLYYFYKNLKSNLKEYTITKYNSNSTITGIIPTSSSYKHIYIQDTKIRPVQIGDNLQNATLYFDIPDNLDTSLFIASNKAIEFTNENYYFETTSNDNVVTLDFTDDANSSNTTIYMDANGTINTNSSTFTLPDTELEISAINNETLARYILVDTTTIPDPLAPANVNVSYSTTDLTNQDVTVTLTSDKKIQEVDGWTLSTDSKVLTKTFSENTSGQVLVKTLNNVETNVSYTITNIDKTPPTIDIIYSPQTPTNQTVEVTLTSDKNIQVPDSWEKNGDTSVKKTFSENTTEIVSVKDVAGNVTNTEVKITNIDKEVPTITLTSDGTPILINDIPTYTKDVIVSYADNVEIKKATALDYNTQLERNISTPSTFTEGNILITVTDTANNTETKRFNIDKAEIQTTSLEYSTTEPTQENVIVTVTFNRAINEITGWSASDDKKTFTKTYTDNINETIEVSDILGHTSSFNVIITNIDRTSPELEVSYSTTEPTNQNVIAIIVANEKIQGADGWTLADDKKSILKEYEQNINETITVLDIAGNSSTIDIAISNINKTPPTLIIEYSTTESTEEPVTVTITSDKPIQLPSTWSYLTSERKIITKSFEHNINTSYAILDDLGNTSIANISITNIISITYDVWRELEYNGDVKFKCNLTIDGNKVPIEQISSIKIYNPIIDISKETFYVGSFISQKLTIKFKNLDGLNIQSNLEVNLSLGLDVNGTTEYLSIGKFLIDDLAENYWETCEITCLDYAIKLKPNIDYSKCFVDGKATIDTILEYICNTFKVKLQSNYPKTNGDIEIGTYDSTVSGKQWISYIAEIKGCNAKFDRNGTLRLIPLKQAPTLTINALKSAKWKLGEKYQISEVLYFDALRNFQKGNSDKNILYIRSDNPFIEGQSTIDNIYDVVKDTTIWNVNVENYADVTLNPWEFVTYTLGEESYTTFYNIDFTYEMNIWSKNEVKIPSKQQEVTTNVVGSPEINIKSIKSELDLVKGTATITAKNVKTLTDQTKSNFEDLNENLEKNYATISQVDKLVVDAISGVTNEYTSSGGLNVFKNTTFSANTMLNENQQFEYWYGKADRIHNTDSINTYSIILKTGSLYQTDQVANNNYTISFYYKLLNPLANVSVKINDKYEYSLTNTSFTLFQTGEINNETKEYITQPITINDNTLKIEFISDIDDSCEIYDIMCNVGLARLVYSQNANEVVTDTVTIGKGITITTSDSDVKFTANNDGIRTLDNQNNVLSEFTDKGMINKEMIIQEEATIVGILRQRVGDQIWDSVI